jgi:hypothetical protein
MNEHKDGSLDGTESTNKYQDNEIAAVKCFRDAF